MNINIPEMLLERLSDLVYKKTGLYFPENRWNDLKRAIISYAEDLKSEDPYLCINSLLSSPEEKIKLLVEKLTVGETYFFRDRKTYEILEEKILPDLMKTRKDTVKYLRIWSAGCSTGEEPYSIAIVFDKITGHLREWNLKIIATDINNVSLEKARAGLYKEWSFRDTPLWVKDGYFEKIDKNTFSIKDEIKKSVTFSCLNLSEDIYPSILNNTCDIDIIFCRNVLMYFSAEVMGKVINRFYDSLSDGGWLFISPSESSCLDGSKFVPVSFHGAILYKKDNYSTNKIYSGNLQTELLPHVFPCNFLPENIEKPVEQSEKESNHSNDPTEYELSLKLYREGRYREASQKLEEFLNNGHISSSHTEAMVILAKSYVNQRNFSLAEEWCKKAIEYKKTDKNYYYLLSTVFQEENKIEEAIISLKKAVYLDENFVLPYFSLGNLYLKQGKSKDAKKQFENALSILDIMKEEEILPEADGITAGKMKEIVKMMI